MVPAALVLLVVAAGTIPAHRDLGDLQEIPGQGAHPRSRLVLKLTKRFYYPLITLPCRAGGWSFAPR